MSCLVEQPPHCDLLRLSLLTRRFVRFRRTRLRCSEVGGSASPLLGRGFFALARLACDSRFNFVFFFTHPPSFLDSLIVSPRGSLRDGRQAGFPVSESGGRARLPREASSGVFKQLAPDKPSLQISERGQLLLKEEGLTFPTE